MFVEELPTTIANPVEGIRKIVSAAVFRQRSVRKNIGVNQLFEVLPNRRLTLGWIDVIELFQRWQLRGMAENVLEQCESCLLGNDVEPIPDGLELIRRLIGGTHYVTICVVRQKVFRSNTNQL